ncbi:MAG: arginyltransferase [Stellaceae bacterium]
MDGTGSAERPKTRRTVGRQRPAAPAPDLPQHFYRTASLPCPYLEGRIERKLVTELRGYDAGRFYNELSRGGFRRSHHLAYRPACAGCSACVPARIVAPLFVAGRSLRRVAARNADIRVRVVAARASFDQYRVFVRYQHARHPESEMAAMSFGDYRAMIEDSPVETFFLEARGTDDQVMGGCLVDLLDDGLSAVYSFYDPGEGGRSLGSYLILALVAEAQRRAMPYVYLGYWIAGSPKMGYKARFRPLEGLGPQGWRLVDP